MRGALGSGVRVQSVEPLTGGTYNASYAIHMNERSFIVNAVLKVAPPPDLPSLTYERDILRTEADWYALAAKEAACPVPEVLATDFSRKALSSDFMIVTKLRGRPLHGLRLSRADRARVRREVGSIAARLRRLRAERCGYPQLTTAATWREGFLGMVDALMADARRYGVRIPDLAAAVRSRADVLDAVGAPSFVHFDLWDGNVFVHEGRVEGIIDGERAFGGDPDAELVSLALFGNIERDRDFLGGFAAEGGAIEFSPERRARLALYRAYLYAIMIVEGAPRRLTGPVNWVLRAYFRRHLARALRQLSRPG